MFGRKAIDHTRFAAAAVSSAKEVEIALSKRRKEMDQEWDDLEKGWQDLGEKTNKAGIIKPSDTDDGMLWLNAGGSEVSVLRSVVTRGNRSSKNFILADLFENVMWDERLPRDSDGRVVLDESPCCVKRIINELIRNSGNGDTDIAPDNGAPTDEEPYLMYLSSVFGMPGLVPPGGMSITGGSAILEGSNVGQLTTTIQGWCAGEPNELKLLYRASRDGWNNHCFHRSCKNASPTITLFRVRQPNDSGSSDSIVGGFSSIPWTGGRNTTPTPAFLFTIMDGSLNESIPFQPVKWDIMHVGRHNEKYGHPRSSVESGPAFGRDQDLMVEWTPNSATLLVKNGTYPLGKSLSRLHNRPVMEIETFGVCFTAATAKQSLLAESACRTKVLVAAPTQIPPATACEEEHRMNIDTFGWSMAGALIQERLALRGAQIELVAACDKISAAVNALAAVYGPDVAAGKEDPVVELTVRGIRMTTLLSTLQACPESFLATKFNQERWPATDKDVDENGRQLIDCSPSVFAKVLDVLRMRKREAWAGIAPKQGCDGLVRVKIKAEDRGAFEEFVEQHFPGNLQRFIMDCVEPTNADSG